MRSIVAVLLALCGSVALAAPTLTGPATAQTGSTITVLVAGSGNPRDFVTVTPKGAPEGTYQSYEIRHCSEPQACDAGGAG